MQANFIKRVLTSQPHIQLIPPDEVARPLRAVTARLVEARDGAASAAAHPLDRPVAEDPRRSCSTWPDVINVSPTMTGSALAVRGDASRSITLTGVDPDGLFQDRYAARLDRRRAARV